MTGEFLLRTAARALAQAYRLHEAEIEAVSRWGDVARQAGRKWERDGSLGIDVGAALGVYTVALRRCCEFTIAVDPHPSHVSFIERCAWPDVVALQCAAKDRDEQAWLQADPGRAYQPLGAIVPIDRQPEGSGFPVAGRRLDTILGETPVPFAPRRVFLKIDAEGHEERILDGLGAWIDAPEVVMLIEIEARSNPGWRLTLQKIADHGFSGYLYRSGRLQRADPEPFIAAQVDGFPDGPGRFGRLKGYRNTFFFLRRA
jgi:FkbM family methyltransferase